ncbi:hypothetical protein V500_01335 [Pseudogymnoascus sp. VKM F-4518 (FW-2643)]|nr:hypothetical protein V500_01335 [Pseudogymnoascus sp. VKM F-4518 (FW-2643)]
MKDVIVHPRPTLHTVIHDIPVPTPGPDEVVIEVIVAGSNVKDWLHITTQGLSVNSGDDIAGTISALGANVEATGEFSIGDRVAAFHPMLMPGGAYAEYATAPAHTVFKLPRGTSFEEAATIPLVTLTAALSLFRRQGLPPPWSPRTSSMEPVPLIIYGASSALGSFAIKLAKIANIHPIIAICGGSKNYVSTLLDSAKGDTLVDYREGIDPMKAAVRVALGPLDAKHALDAISANATWIPLSQMLSPSGSQMSVTSGGSKYDDAEIPAGVEIKYTYVGTAHYGAYKTGMPKQPVDKESVEGDVEFAYLFVRYLSRLLAKGRFEGHPYEVIPGGLDGVARGLQKLKNGEARGFNCHVIEGDTSFLKEASTKPISIS